MEYPQELSKIADTVVVCAIDSAYAGYLLLSDTLKEDARKAIEDLKALNINNIQILSGDKQAIVTNFAEKLGVTQAYGDLLPDGKVEHIGTAECQRRISFCRRRHRLASACPRPQPCRIVAGAG